MTEEKKEEYITLFQATKICSYSEPYLRLRARQGKLKSIKLGKKWMTTADWISDYVMRAKEWNDRVAAKKSLAEQNLLVGDPGEKPQTAPEVFQAAVAIAEPQIVPAAITPREDIANDENVQAAGVKSSLDELKTNRAPDLAFIFATGVAFALLIFFGVSYGNNNAANLSKNVQYGNTLAASVQTASGQEMAAGNGSLGSKCRCGQASVSTMASPVREKQDLLREILLGGINFANNLKSPW